VRKHIKRFVQRYALAAGIFLMFVFTWPVDLGLAAYSRGLIGFQIPEMVGILVGYGIVIASLIITALIAGKTGVKQLLRRFLIWRVALKWYAAALFLPPALMLIAIGIYSLLNQPPDFNQIFAREMFGSEISPLVLLLPFFLWVTLTNGEEIGWRGFALPRLQARYSVLAASLILGVIWAFWHLPKYLMVDTTLGGGRGIDQFAIESVKVIGQAILYTWLFNRTQGSLLLTSLFHGAWNAAWVFLPMQAVGAIDLVVYWLAAILIVALNPAEWLGRRTEAAAVQASLT
jgi:uncharacterized protein